MTGIAAIILLLSVVCAVCDDQLKLINELNNFFNFDHNLFILDSSVDIDRFTNTDINTPQTLYVVTCADDNITGLESLTEIKSKNTFMVIVLRIFPCGSNLKLLVNRIKDIQQLQVNIKIGIFFSHFVSGEDLERLFEWCKKRLIVHVFAATYLQPGVHETSNPERTLNIFTFNPFGALHVMNVTGQTYKRFFASLNSNFQQHQIRLGLPFQENHDKELWLTVFQLMNASYILEENNYTERSEFSDNGLNIPLLNAQEKLEELLVYPMVTLPQLIIVPEAPPYSDFAAYLRSATSDTFFVFSLLTISAAVLLLTIFRYIKEKKILFFQSVADVINLIVNDNEHIKYQRLSRGEVFLIVPLTFVGFLIVNGILSNMQSYLTKPVLQPQINTIEDIYRSAFPILAKDEFWYMKLTEALTSLTKYEDWKDKIIQLSGKEFYDQVESFNRSICFFRDSIHVNIVLRAQKRLNLKVYHNPQIEIYNFHFSYLINETFIYFERLNEIIHRIKGAGLFTLWFQKDVYEMESRVLKKYHEDSSSREVNIVQRFHFPIFIVYGWFAGVIVLIIEIIWKNFRFSVSEKFKRILTDKFGQYVKVNNNNISNINVDEIIFHF